MIKIGAKCIGDGNSIFIMADVGVTNGGDFERSKKLIRLAADAGADAIKFQFIGRDDLLGADRSTKASYLCHDGTLKEDTLYNLFEPFEYTEREWKALFDFSKDCGLEFICTSHVLQAVPILESIGVEIHKICAWGANHKRLIQLIGSTGKPLMLDTGNYTVTSLQRTLDWHSMAGGRGAVILHDFHTLKVDEMNFKAIPFIKRYYGYPVGYTPQFTDADYDFLSIGLGVNVLERRLTLDRTMPGLGHSKAYEFEQFSTWVKRVRDAEVALGFETVLPTSENLKDTKKYFKSLFLTTAVESGHVLRDSDILAYRPGDGIPAGSVDEVIGKTVKHNLPAGHKLAQDDFY